VRNLPPCRTVELPGRGKTYVADSGPVTDSPTFLLLHSVACTGLMTWYPALEMMRSYGRVIVFDQRWHGHGIHSPGFALEACADDVAALADALGVRRFVAVGYSMGSLVAQLVWHRHPHLVNGLVLCAGAATFARAKFEQVALRLFAAAIEGLSPRPGLPTVPPTAVASRVRYDREWLWDQFRSTSPVAVAGAIAECAKFDSRSWVSEIDVPTSVVITLRDWVISAERQQRLAGRIPRAHVVTVDAGHACCTLQADRFVPALEEAVDAVCQLISPPQT
jgi:diacylglycerol O-acyltransferase